MPIFARMPSRPADTDVYFEQSRPSFLLSRLAGALRRQSRVILGAFAVFLVALLILGAVAVLLAPAQRVVSLPFRVEFQGAERGLYPSGAKFSASEIVATPILKRVHEANGLGRFIPFGEFSESIFVVESNRALEALTREYSAKLSDNRLSAVDRERLEAEFSDKRATLSRNEYALTYASDSGDLSKTLVIKALTDVLSTWAEVAAEEKGVLEYQIPVLSVNVLRRDALTSPDAVVALDVLRTRIDSVLRNIDELEKAPGAIVLRAGPLNLSLSEVRLLLSDLMRFRVQPLLLLQLDRQNAGSDSATIHFLQSQLSYNRRQLDLAGSRVDALTTSLRMYSRRSEASPESEPERAAADAVTPQLSDDFLERLIQLTNQGQDIEYRQQVVDEIRDASLQLLPYQQEVEHYEELLRTIGASAAGGAPATDDVRQQMAAIVDDVAEAIQHLNAIYDRLSLNLNPSTILYTVTAPPETRIERPVSARELALWGVLAIILFTPIIIGGALIRDRLHEEEVELELASGEESSSGAAPDTA